MEMNLALQDCTVGGNMKRGKPIHILLLLLFVCQGSLWAQGADHAVSIASYKSLFSNVLNEERTFAVSLPLGYDDSEKRYPVLYILDAEYRSYPSAVGLVHYLGGYAIPEMIIVGIPNTNRNRDLWSHPIEGLASTEAGGADNFIDFLSQELIPFIDRTYRTTAHRTIYGRSAAGHFVTYCLFSHPELFEAYLASSPVIGFSENHLLTTAEAFLQNQRSLAKSFYIYYGDTDYNSVVQRIPLLESIIERYHPEGFRWAVERVEGRHGPPESLYQLLLMLYADWQPIPEPIIVPFSGEFLHGESIEVHISTGADPVYYTLSGEEPSPLYKTKEECVKILIQNPQPLCSPRFPGRRSPP
jgi:predicted alpha/beta superfamily hydrolase